MQRIVATIGAPRSGKSTFAETFDPNYWVTCTYDDFRQTLWPPHRRIYWQVREGPNGVEAQTLLHRVKTYAITEALYQGFNVVSPDTYTRQIEADVLKEIGAAFRIQIEWKLLEIPWEVLKHRNDTSDVAKGHQVPDEILKAFYDRVWSPDAWWRGEPNVEIIKFTGDLPND